MASVSLLAITFLLGVGSALMGPVWQTIMPALVPRAELEPAVALNSLGINIARAIGPTLGGVTTIVWSYQRHRRYDDLADDAALFHRGKRVARSA